MHSVGAQTARTCYTNDSLNRLAGLGHRHQLGQSGYDGFGNLTAKTVTAGSAMQFSASYNSATNQGPRYYDANGNSLGGGTQLAVFALQERVHLARFFADSGQIYAETQPILGGGVIRVQRAVIHLETGKQEVQTDMLSQGSMAFSYQALANGALLGPGLNLATAKTEVLVKVELPTYRETKRAQFAENRSQSPRKTETPVMLCANRKIFAYGFDCSAGSPELNRQFYSSTSLPERNSPQSFTTNSMAAVASSYTRALQ